MLPEATGRVFSSFSRRTIPSLAISCARTVVSSDVVFEIVPLPLIRSIIVLIGPVRIIFTHITIPVSIATSAVPLTSFLVDFLSFITAIMITIATAIMIPIAIKKGLIELMTFITSSRLIDNID